MGTGQEFISQKLAEERRLARNRGEEYAEVMRLGLSWTPAAPLPHMLCGGNRAFILFYLERELSPNNNGQPISVSSRDPSQASLGMVELIGVYGICNDGPNDEGLDQHRLYGKGLTFYSAHEVYNSRWKEERSESAAQSHHYVFTFQDETIECLAQSLRVEEMSASFADA